MTERRGRGRGGIIVLGGKYTGLCVCVFVSVCVRTCVVVSYSTDS